MGVARQESLRVALGAERTKRSRCDLDLDLDAMLTCIHFTLFTLLMSAFVVHDHVYL